MITEETRPLYKWAATIFVSRCFPGSALANSSLERVANTLDLECPVLIPGMDLLNHCPFVKVVWLWGRSNCSIINDAPIAIGRTTQIWNNYGPKSNEECENNSVCRLRSPTLTNFFLASNSWLWLQSLPQSSRGLSLGCFFGYREADLENKKFSGRPDND